MIILHVANLHFRPSWFRWLSTSAPPHDLLVIAGDLLDRQHKLSHERQAAWVSQWVREHAVPVCIASGFHDLVREAGGHVWRPAEWLRDMTGPQVWIDGEFRELGGLGVLPLPPGGVTRGEPADVWVVHRGPAGPGVSWRSSGADEGDPFLLYAVRKYQPRLLLCGHLHTPHSWIQLYEGTLYLNPGCRDDAPYPNHIVIDFGAGQLRRVSAGAGGVDRPCIVPLPDSLSLGRSLLAAT